MRLFVFNHSNQKVYLQRTDITRPSELGPLGTKITVDGSDYPVEAVAAEKGSTVLIGSILLGSSIGFVWGFIWCLILATVFSLVGYYIEEPERKTVKEFNERWLKWHNGINNN